MLTLTAPARGQVIEHAASDATRPSSDVYVMEEVIPQGGGEAENAWSRDAADVSRHEALTDTGDDLSAFVDRMYHRHALAVMRHDHIGQLTIARILARHGALV
jgi:hypothetical protein